MALQVNVSGVWKTLSHIYVNVSGVWKTVETPELNVGGVWKTAAIGDVTLTAQTGANQASDLANGTAVFWINADGTVDVDDSGGRVQVNSGTDWIIPNGAANGQYEWKWDLVSGDSPTSTPKPAEGVWEAISTDRKIGCFAGGSYETGIVTISIRLNGGSTLASANFEYEGIDVP
jgi:hypothetical protein